MRLPRFRVRTLMVAVAVAGVCSAGTAARARFERNTRFYQRRAAQHRMYANADRFHARGDALAGGVACGPFGCLKIPAFDPTLSPQLRATRSAYHRGLQFKYEHAACYPWLPVPPDPPEPE